MFIIKKKGKIYLIILIVFISIFTSCGKSNTDRNSKTVDIYNIVKESFLTNKGYSDELSKHISQEVFKSINIYNIYAVNNPEYRKPLKVDFNLKEDSQTAKEDIVYVKMIYSVSIKDSQNKLIGGSWDVPITFTVKKTVNGGYIIKEEQPA